MKKCPPWSKTLVLILVLLIPIGLSINVEASSKKSRERALEQFQEDSKQFINQQPKKVWYLNQQDFDQDFEQDTHQRAIRFSSQDPEQRKKTAQFRKTVKRSRFLERIKQTFSKEEWSERKNRLEHKFAEWRDQFRVKILCRNGNRDCEKDMNRGGRRPIEFNDLPENLVYNANVIRRLSKMDGALQAGKLDESPWSDDYWPIYKGQISSRYAHDHLPNSTNFRDHYLFSQNSCSPDLLSPAEKYDLLVGDRNDGLKVANFQSGLQYAGANMNDKVETWMGLCHGWAPAAYMERRPSHAVEVTDSNGRKLRFYPSDIKALATSLWANVQTPTRFIGGRCNSKGQDLQTDSLSGAVKDQDCFDNNPGSWHIAVVNQISKAKKSFILDATYDYEVWNQPVYAYRYRYFNPMSMKEVDTFGEARVSYDQFRSQDRFRNVRKPKSGTEYVIGIVMDVSYVVETAPSHRKTDHQKYDAITTVTYYYDLELARNNSILGGEWYQNKHPDFLWTPEENSDALTRTDRMIAKKNWSDSDLWSNLSQPVSNRLQDLASRESGNSGAPLNYIVDRLIFEARK